MASVRSLSCMHRPLASAQLLRAASSVVSCVVSGRVNVHDTSVRIDIAAHCMRLTRHTMSSTSQHAPSKHKNPGYPSFSRPHTPSSGHQAPNCRRLDGATRWWDQKITRFIVREDAFAWRSSEQEACSKVGTCSGMVSCKRLSTSKVGCKRSCASHSSRRSRTISANVACDIASVRGTNPKCAGVFDAHRAWRVSIRLTAC